MMSAVVLPGRPEAAAGARDFARKAAKFFIGSSVVGNGVEDACAAFDRWAATGVSAFSAGVGAWLWLLFTVVYALRPASRDALLASLGAA